MEPGRHPWGLLAEQGRAGRICGEGGAAAEAKGRVGWDWEARRRSPAAVCLRDLGEKPPPARLCEQKVADGGAWAR